MKPFRHVGALRPRRSRFDLTHSKLGTCFFGQLIPVMCQEVVPGDKFKIGCEVIIRFQPMVAPILHEVNAYVHYFYVPYRLLTGWYLPDTTQPLRQELFNWEGYITGGKTGATNIPLPRWNPTTDDLKVGSLWDYFGFPVDPEQPNTGENFDVAPLAFPFMAYSLVYHDYYRDVDIQSGNMLDMSPGMQYTYPTWARGQPGSMRIGYYNGIREGMPLYRNWQKDYFTSARPTQQRGTAPALPMRGTLPVQLGLPWIPDQPNRPVSNVIAGWTNLPDNVLTIAADNPAQGYSGRLGVNVASAVTFNVSDLRLAFQLQKYLERNMRSGTRYTEFLRAHFGIAPSDSRLDRPEYIGGHRSPVVISEVLQTSRSEANAPQANMAGHGLTASHRYVGSYTVKEYGLILGLLSVMQKPMYEQGINRQWLRYNRFDFYSPEFAHLSEQGIYRAELYWRAAKTTNPMIGTTTDSQVFGFQGRWDELRTVPSMVVSEMRDLPNSPNLSFWHMGRRFTGMPTLSSQFIRNDGTSARRCFAVEDRAPIIFHVNNIITAVRPLPPISEPGLIDHY